MYDVALVDADSIAYLAGYAETYLMMRKAVDNKIAKIKKDTKAKEVKIYIEEWRKNKNNFRAKIFDKSNDLVKQRGYKGNRHKRPDQMPKFLHQARVYLHKHHRAVPVTEYESEDVCIREAYKALEQGLNPVVCCIDKDLLQHPLTFYNYNTYSYNVLSEEGANLALARQILSGDSTDNIPGIPGVGKIKARSYVPVGSSNPLETVAKVFMGHGFDYDYFIEQYNLIYIRKEETTDVLFPITKERWNEIKEQ